MIDIDATIDKAPPEYKAVLKAEKETDTRIHETTKVVDATKSPLFEYVVQFPKRE